MVGLTKLVLGESIAGLFADDEIKERLRWLDAAGTFECGATGDRRERESERASGPNLICGRNALHRGAGGEDQVTMVTVACA
jgi:hypothetical protein